jgi:hypothetical protein
MGILGQVVSWVTQVGSPEGEFIETLQSKRSADIASLPSKF